MNTDNGVIRTIPQGEEPKPHEIQITALERDVLDGYKPEYRPELLARWRDGRLRLQVTKEGTKLVEARVITRQQRRHQQVLEKSEHAKRRRHQAALSRARNRR